MSNPDSTKRARKYIDLTGQVFGRLTPIRRVSGTKTVSAYWVCACSCGSKKGIPTAALTSGATRSCGCQKIENVTKATTTHGMSNKPEYRVWVQMWSRCTNPRDKKYHLYKDRIPPQEWRDFGSFYTDMGPRPEGRMTIERVDNTEPYGPSNCKWATYQAQAQNMRSNVVVLLNGERVCLAKACRDVGLNYESVIQRRGKYGKTMLEASLGKFDLAD